MLSPRRQAKLAIDPQQLNPGEERVLPAPLHRSYSQGQSTRKSNCGKAVRAASSHHARSPLAPPVPPRSAALPVTAAWVYAAPPAALQLLRAREGAGCAARYRACAAWHTPVRWSVERHARGLLATIFSKSPIVRKILAVALAAIVAAAPLAIACAQSTAQPPAEESGTRSCATRTDLPAALDEDPARLAREADYRHREVQAAERRLGPRDPCVADHLLAAARLDLKLARYAEARSAQQRALAIRESALGLDNPETALALLELATVETELARHGEAHAFRQRALRTLEHTRGPAHPDTARALNDLASSEDELGRSDRALPLRQRALTVREARLGAEHPDTAQSYADLAATLDRLDQSDQALPLRLRALLAVEKILGPQHPDAARALNGLATTYSNLARHADALPLEQRALAIFDRARGPDHPATADALTNLADTLSKLGRYLEAVPLQQRALGIYERRRGPEHPHTAEALSSLAGTYGQLARHAEALLLEERGLAITEHVHGPSHPRTADALTNTAIAYMQLGRADAALPLFERALAVRRGTLPPGHRDIGRALGNTAFTLGQLGRHDEALPLQREALGIIERSAGPAHPDVALAMSNLAFSHAQLGNADEAWPLYSRALAVRSTVWGVAHPVAIAAALDVAGVRLRMGDRAGALPMLYEALALSMRADDRDRQWRAQAWLRLAHAQAGEGDAAIFWGKQAVNTVQGIRVGLGSLRADWQQSFLQRKRGVYTDLADLLIERGRLAEAEQVLALLKEYELFELLRGDAPRGRADLTGTEAQVGAEYEAQLRSGVAQARELDNLERRVDTEGELPPDDEARLQHLRAEALRWKDAFQRWAGALQRGVTRDAAALIGRGPRELEGTTQLQAALGRDKGAVGLHYVVTDERLSIVLVTPQGRFGRQVPVRRVELNRQAAALRQALQDRRADPRPAAQALYDTLIAPVAAEIEEARADTLILSLTELLRYVPFAALHDGQRYLVERFAFGVFLLGSASHTAPSRTQARVAGLGMTQATDSLPALAGVRKEIGSIVRTEETPDGIMAGTISLDNAFTRGRLRTSLNGTYSTVHIGSHFVFRPGDARNSFLLLGDGTRMTLDELAQLNFSRVEQVTLSACDTASGGGANEHGIEVEGLAAAIAQRLPHAVLGTLWPVADASTALAMRRFYEGRAAEPPRSRAQALRAAQLALLRGEGSLEAAARNEARGATRSTGAGGSAAFTPDLARPYAHPYYWAPFILLGSWL